MLQYTTVNVLPARKCGANQFKLFTRSGKSITIQIPSSNTLSKTEAYEQVLDGLYDKGSPIVDYSIEIWKASMRASNLRHAPTHVTQGMVILHREAKMEGSESTATVKYRPWPFRPQRSNHFPNVDEYPGSRVVTDRSDPTPKISFEVSMNICSVSIPIQP